MTTLKLKMGIEKHWITIVFLIVISLISISGNVPKIYAPMPLTLVLPIFLGVPFWIILLIAPICFLMLLHRNRLMTWLYVLVTGLSISNSYISWEYGLVYQGREHTTAVTLINVLIICFLYFLWKKQKINMFRILLVAWIFTYAFPYLGEMP